MRTFGPVKLSCRHAVCSIFLGVWLWCRIGLDIGSHSAACRDERFGVVFFFEAVFFLGAAFLAVGFFVADFFELFGSFGSGGTVTLSFFFAPGLAGARPERFSKSRR